MCIPILLLGNGSVKFYHYNKYIHAIIEELLNVLFSVWFLFYQVEEAINYCQTFYFGEKFSSTPGRRVSSPTTHVVHA
jgi:hypothetical protein